MVTRTFITLVCDMCGKDETRPDELDDTPDAERVFVNGHTVSINGKTVALELCQTCEPTGLFQQLLEIGRKVR